MAQKKKHTVVAFKGPCSSINVSAFFNFVLINLADCI